MKPLSEALDWILPGILSIIVGKHQAEVVRLLERVKNWGRWMQLHLDAIVQHSLLAFVREIHQRFLVIQLALVVLATVITFKATGFCGPVDLPLWLRLLPLVSLAWLAPGAYRVYEDRRVQPLPAHIVDGRLSTRLLFRDFTTEQRAAEYAAHGSVLRRDAETNADASLTDEQKTEEVTERARLRKEFRARQPFAPLMSAAELEQAALPYGADRAHKASVFAHLTALIYETLPTALAIFGSAVALGSYSYTMGGVNLVFPMLVGLVAFAALMVAYVGWAISVRAPLTVTDGVAQATKQPITGIFHLILQIAPQVTDQTVRAQFGEFSGELIKKVAEFTEKWEKRPFAALLVLFVFGLLMPHWLTLLVALSFAAVTAASHSNLETVGVDTLARRKVAAERLDRAVIIGLVLQFTVLGIALFARDWFGGLVTSVLTHVNTVLHIGYREAYVTPSPANGWHEFQYKGWTFVRAAIAFLFLAGIASWAFDKARDVWGRRLGALATALMMMLFLNQLFEVPTIAAEQIGRQVSFACPTTRPATAIAQSVPVVAPVTPPTLQPSAPVEPPPVVYAPSSTAALPVRLPEPRRSRRGSHRGDVVSSVNVERDCVPLADVVRCNELSPDVREDIRASCGCR